MLSHPATWRPISGGLSFLDAASWRHYLLHLLAYALRHAEAGSAVGDDLLQNLRPPDRDPPRLASLSPEQKVPAAGIARRLCSTCTGSWAVPTAIAVIWGESAASWTRHRPWAADRRTVFLQRIAAEVVRCKAPGCRAEIQEPQGWIHIRSGCCGR